MASSQPIPLPLSCDDAYFSLFTQTQIETLPISDHDYAVELQLQEAIMSSLTSPKTTPFPINKNEPGGNYYYAAVKSEPQEPTAYFSTPPNPTPIPIKKEPGESSRFLCEICADSKDNDAVFPIPNCAHKFCTDCISRHVSVLIGQKSTSSQLLRQALPCPAPGCGATVGMDACRRILSEDTLTVLDDVLCESMIEPWQRFYCPYKECSALLVKDEEEDGILEAECPTCHRLMCVRCSAPWHAGMGCDEYVKLGEAERGRDDLLVHNMAKTNFWKRCGACGFYVERNQGCSHMTCRCGHQFCYGCGKIWAHNHVCNAAL